MKNWIKFLFYFIPPAFLAQENSISTNIPLSEDMNQVVDYWNIKTKELSFHSSFKPFLSRTISKSADSAVCEFDHFQIWSYGASKVFNNQPEKRNPFRVQLLPIADVGIGYDVLERKIKRNLIGGVKASLFINDDFTFSSTVFGGNISLPFYMDSMYKQNKVVPGYGRVYGENETGYQVFDYTGYLSYSPGNNKYFNFQMGRDKHFVGDGYRSVLLSDYANPYPFVRINANVWRLQYNVWYTWMLDPTNANHIKKSFTNKYAVFHYLSYNIIEELQIGFFENVVWRGSDSNQVRSFDVNYLNPLVFFRPQEFAVGSPDNSFIGLNINAKLFNTIKLYGQLGLDEFFLKEIRARNGWWANKQAWQLGLKYINAFSLKGLSLQAEYNEIRPYTYTHGLVSQNYAHDALALAHPYGANLREFISCINYRKGKWQLSLRGNLLYLGKDTLASTSSNIGQNIYLSYTTRPYEYGHKTLQGDKNTILQSDVKLVYLILPQLNARLEIGYIQRSESSTMKYKLENPFVYVAFKTSFWNFYND
ncbi:MAG: hypothetical protein AB7O73_13555 [Bacteroidia bacterium]